jgi:hypothetical protein
MGLFPGDKQTGHGEAGITYPHLAPVLRMSWPVVLKVSVHGIVFLAVRNYNKLTVCKLVTLRKKESETHACAT